MAFKGSPQKCKVCEKTVYIAEMISTNGVAYHNTCFRCKHCNGRLAVRFCDYIYTLIFSTDNIFFIISN